MIHKVFQGDCEEDLENLKDEEFFEGIHLAFLDPPFNQDKSYRKHNDNMPEEDYWEWMKRVISKIYELTVEGGAIYFMQREKNTEYVLRVLRETGWHFQNLIAWNKLTSAIPSKYRFSKKYQIIAYFTKGKKPRVFNRLRYEPPLLAMHKYERDTGIYVTDIWDNIRELTSGYFAGDEAIRVKNGKLFTEEGDRFHKQQSPVELLTRIILSSSKVSDFVLDPFAGTGVTAIVSKQLKRNSISIELDPENVEAINKRLELMRNADDISNLYSKYLYTENLDKIWFDIVEHDSKAENFELKAKPKVKLNNMLLMEETIKYHLIEELRIPENKIKLDYRLKDKDNKVHRFELAVEIEPQVNLVFRVIYAKSKKQANTWSERVKLEQKKIKDAKPNFKFVCILSGIAFVEYIEDLKTNIEHLAPFFGWEVIYDLPEFSNIVSNIDLIERIKVKKQELMDTFL
ncbi:MAG: hypothetical protein GF311_17485 [Candidatus Lokiarchaeota archaeon]|nr:hypothetical protein [Candidatus Lokiarchaeota archaeon]